MIKFKNLIQPTFLYC